MITFSRQLETEASYKKTGLFNPRGKLGQGRPIPMTECAKFLQSVLHQQTPANREQEQQQAKWTSFATWERLNFAETNGKYCRDSRVSHMLMQLFRSE